jgi:hypothetical protein
MENIPILLKYVHYFLQKVKQQYGGQTNSIGLFAVTSVAITAGHNDC